MVSPAKHPALSCMERVECAMGTLFPIFTFFCVKNHDKHTLIKGEDGVLGSLLCTDTVEGPKHL